MMRALLLTSILLSACSMSSGSGATCQMDGDCGSEVCALTSECLAVSQVRTVKLTWTIRGVAADDTSCGSHPDLFVQFDAPDYNDKTPGFEQVACRQGQFTVFKVPMRYQQAEVGIEGRPGDISAIDASGQASFDIYP